MSRACPYMAPRSLRLPALSLITVCLQPLQIRSVFRVIEGIQGYFGSLATNQAAFFLLDSLPLFIAVSIYVPFWPGRFIDTNRLRQEQHIIKERYSPSYTP